MTNEELDTQIYQLLLEISRKLDIQNYLLDSILYKENNSEIEVKELIWKLHTYEISTDVIAHLLNIKEKTVNNRIGEKRRELGI